MVTGTVVLLGAIIYGVVRVGRGRSTCASDAAIRRNLRRIGRSRQLMWQIIGGVALLALAFAFLAAVIISGSRPKT